MKHAATSVVGTPRAPLCPPLRSLAVSLFGRIGPLACALAIAGIAVGNAQPPVASVPADTLFGGSTGHIVTLDQNDGSLTTLAPQPGFSFRAKFSTNAQRHQPRGSSLETPHSGPAASETEGKTPKS